MRIWFNYIIRLFGIVIGIAWAGATFLPSFIDIFRGFLYIINPSNAMIKKIESLNISVWDFWIFAGSMGLGILWGAYLTIRELRINRRLPRLEL